MKTCVVVLVTITIGLVSQYSEGTMERVVRYRQTVDGRLSRTLPKVDGFIATKNCDEIGHIRFLRQEGGKWERFLVADCALPNGDDGACAWMDGDNPWNMPVLAEIGYRSAERWNTVGEMAFGEMRDFQVVEMPCSHMEGPLLVLERSER